MLDRNFLFGFDEYSQSLKNMFHNHGSPKNQSIYEYKCMQIIHLAYGFICLRFLDTLGWLNP